MSDDFKRSGRGITSRADALAGSSKYSFSLDAFDGAVTKTALNMMRSDEGFVTVKAPEKIGEIDENLSGRANAVRARCSESGIELMRIGYSLYATKANGEFVRVASECFNGARTVIYHIDNAFYATDSNRLHKVTDSLVYSVVSPTVPKVYKGIGPDESHREFDEMPNVLTDFVDVQYSLSTRTDTFYVPLELAVGELVSVTQSSGVPYSGTMTFTRQTALIGAKVVLGTTVGNTVTMRFKLSNSGAFENSFSLADFSAARTALFYSTLITKHYPCIGDYNTVLGLCGYDKRYYLLGISDPVYITADSVAYCRLDEKPTAQIDYSDGVLVFTENKVIYLKSEGDGVMGDDVKFSKNIVKRDFGCDMPSSVAGLDDKIIFGNSKNGIYYLNKFGYSERDGSCPVSAAVDDRLLSSDAADLKNAVAICTKDAYYIAVGDTVYVWHYGEMLPSSLEETLKTRKKYIWSTLDVVNASDFIGISGGDIYYIERTTADVYLYQSRKHGDGTDEIYSEFECRPLDFSSPDEKIVSEMVISAKFSADASVSVYYDGVASGSSYTLSASAFDDVINSYILRPERHKCRNIAVRISSDAPMAISEILFRYYKTGR